MHTKKITNTLLLSLLALTATPTQTFDLSWDTLNDLRQQSVNQIKEHWFISSVVGLSACGYIAYKYLEEPLYWDWSTINTDNLSFPQWTGNKVFMPKINGVQIDDPQPFLWGAGTSHHQVEGPDGATCQNTWDRWAIVQDHVVPAGRACDHWNQFEKHIELLRSMGLNTYRFSIAWSKVMPKPGEINKAAVNHYIKVCQCLKKNNIRPVVGLHHYTEPVWFADMQDKNGNKGWESESNIKHFVEFALTMYEALGDHVYMWSTFNSPSGVAAKGWLVGDAPPGIKDDFEKTAIVLRNLLEAHVQVHDAFHKEYETNKYKNENWKRPRVGILKNIMQLDPWRRWQPFDRIGCYIGSEIVNRSIYRYFTTGIFKVNVPSKVSIEFPKNPRARQSLDFIGLNYYSHKYMRHNTQEKFFNFDRLNEPENRATGKEIRTQNPNYVIYPEGIYRAIKEIHTQIAKPLNIPIYVTENGIAAVQAEKDRELFFRRYLYAISKAIDDGYDIRGYITWSLMDNYEWGSYGKNYGLLEIEGLGQKDASLKPCIKKDHGTTYFTNVVKKNNPECKDYGTPLSNDYSTQSTVPCSE